MAERSLRKREPFRRHILLDPRELPGEVVAFCDVVNQLEGEIESEAGRDPHARVVVQAETIERLLRIFEQAHIFRSCGAQEDQPYKLLPLFQIREPARPGREHFNLVGFTLSRTAQSLERLRERKRLESLTRTGWVALEQLHQRKRVE